ncbi:ABC transporter permease [Streptosporangium sp. NBC_01469]|uniref:ABC transporter permease n=1 Tax=Streptosporangium sp. NBC_01469 TaxID=2903898 RepID=UPI002E2DF4B6|nr:FtsX-like permease family protein [Streptosporangium sp. NBC_01469]
MSALLAALRISRRDARRARGRSALIMLMIGLPVLVVTVFLVLAATADINPREGLTADIGAADARIRVTAIQGKLKQDMTGKMWTSPGGSPAALTRPWTEAAVARLLEPGARLLPVYEGSVDYLARDGRDHVSALEVDLRDPLTAGMYRLARGRAPVSAQEIAVTPEILERGARLGAPLEVTWDRKPMRVVGVLEPSRRIRETKIVGLPGTLLFNRPGTTQETGWLADTPRPVTWATVQRLNAAGLLAVSRAVVENPPDDDELLSTSYDEDQIAGIGLVGVMIVLEVVLLAGPAFAVGLRRRRRELALVAAQGGSPAHLRLIVLADGVVLGCGAAVIGLVLGVGLAWASAPLLLAGLVGVIGPLEIPWALVTAVALLGAASGLVAALVPAVQAARQDPAAVLAGRGGVVRDRVGRPVLGLLLLAAGAAATVFAVRYDVVWVYCAAVLAQLGLVALAPRLVKGAAGLAARLPLPFRLAARDASRHRGRTASAVAAVMTATAAVVAVAIANNSNFAHNRDNFQTIVPAGTLIIQAGKLDDDRWATLKAAARRELPGVPLIEGAKATDAGGVAVEIRVRPIEGTLAERSHLFLPIGDERLLTLVQGRRDPVASAALASGKAVVFDPRLIRDGRLALTLETDESRDQTPGEITVPAVLAGVADPRYAVAVLPPAALRSAGLETRPRVLYADPASHGLSPRQGLGLEWELAGAGPPAGVGVMIEQGFQNDVVPVLWLLMGAAFILVLGGTFVATGLAAADMRSDLATMAAVGAPPGTRRLVVAGQAGFIAGLGVLIGALAGAVTGVAAAWPMTTRTYGSVMLTPAGEIIPSLPSAPPTVEIPWLLLAAVVIGLPVLAALVAGAFTRTKTTLTRRTG